MSAMPADQPHGSDADDIIWVPVNRCTTPLGLCQNVGPFPVSSGAAEPCQDEAHDQCTVRQAGRPGQWDTTVSTAMLGEGVNVGGGAWAGRPRMFVMRQALSIRNVLEQRMVEASPGGQQLWDSQGVLHGGHDVDVIVEEEAHEAASRRPLMGEEYAYSNKKSKACVASTISSAVAEHEAQRPVPALRCTSTAPGGTAHGGGGAKGATRRADGWEKRVLLLQEDVAYYKSRANAAHEQLLLAAYETGRAWDMCKELQDRLKIAQENDTETHSHVDSADRQEQSAYEKASSLLLEEMLMNKQMEVQSKDTELEYVHGELKYLQAEQIKTVSHLKDVRTELQMAQNSQSQTQKELEATRILLHNAQNANADLKASLELTKSTLHKTQAELSNALSDFEQKQAELKGMHSQVEYLKGQVDDERLHADAAAERLLEAQREAYEAKCRADELRKKVKEAQRNSDRQAQEAEERCARFKARCLEAEATLTSMQKKLHLAMQAEAKLLVQLHAAREIEEEREKKLSLLEEVGVALINRFTESTSSSSSSVPRGPISGPDQASGPLDFNSRLDALVSMACARLDELEDRGCCV